MKTKVKTEKLGSLIKKLDTQVSLFVRLNAADQTGTISCVCCGSRVYWKDADCAHYRDRDNMATRFYLPNLGAADPNCNRFDHYGHIQRWSDRLRLHEMVDLETRSHSLYKYSRPELEEMIVEYTEKVKQLRKDKGL